MTSHQIELVFATQNKNKAYEIQGLLPKHIVVKTLKDIDCYDDIPDFHLVLLLEMTKFLGFYPSASKEDFFEMIEGVFVPLESNSCLSKQESDWFKVLLSKKIHMPEKTFTHSQRRHLLDILMDYYSIHIENFRRPKSLEVLKEVFSN